MKRSPAVFAVGEKYQILVPVDKASVMWVKVGDKCYYDHSNGVLKSDVSIHKMTVPQKALNESGKYTICERAIINRKPYFSELEEVVETEFDFHPVPNDDIYALHLADVHGRDDLAVEVAKAQGKIDFLILNGDVLDHSGEIENFDVIYRLCEALTKGNIPVVFSRGNHDLRGKYAECMEDFIPALHDKFYYTFRLGSIWGILVDCGEDKDDASCAYGGTIACHEFREEETEFIESVIKNCASEYGADDVKYKLVISHVPFSHKQEEPFNIEQEIYTKWGTLLKENIKPDLMLSGHTHDEGVAYVGCDEDAYCQPCTIAICSGVRYNQEKEYAANIGAFLHFKDGEISVDMYSSEHEKVLSAHLNC